MNLTGTFPALTGTWQTHSPHEGEPDGHIPCVWAEPAGLAAIRPKEKSAANCGPDKQPDKQMGYTVLSAHLQLELARLFL